MKEAYVNWNAGICRVFTYPDQELIASGKRFGPATRKARKLGYHVRVYTKDGSDVLPPMTTKVDE